MVNYLIFSFFIVITLLIYLINFFTQTMIKKYKHNQIKMLDKIK